MKPGEHAGALIAVSVIAIVFGTIGVSLRIYTRSYVLKQIWLDDYLAVVSYACLIAITISNFYSISNGLGSHMDQIPPSVLPKFFKALWLSLVIYNISLLCLKLTLFFQFYRIIRLTKWYGLKIFTAVIMCLIAGWQIAQIFLQIFSCNPITKSWDMSVQGKCQSVNLMREMNFLGNIISDFIILLLPLPIIWRLALPLRSKYAVAGIFSLGFFTCIISILRVTLTTTQKITDLSWDIIPVVSWTTAELLTAVIVASLSTMRPLISRYVVGFTLHSSNPETNTT